MYVVHGLLADHARRRARQLCRDGKGLVAYPDTTMAMQRRAYSLIRLATDMLPP